MKPEDFSGQRKESGWLGVGLAGAAAAAIWWLCFQAPMFWVTTGMGEPNRPFIDLYGLMVASDAVRLGLDPFLPSPLDPYHRPHVYSDWWFALGDLGLGRKDVLWLGAVLAGSLIVTAVVMTRPRTWRESAALFGVLVSPAFLFAANRGNNDLVVLVVVSLGLLCFRREAGSWRALGIVLFAVSAVLKYYPLVTVVLLLELHDRRRFLAGLGLYVLVLVLAWPGLVPGLKSAALHAPEPVWLYAFGAPVLMRDFDLNRPVLWLVPTALLGLWALISARPLLRDPSPASTGAARDRERDFVCGAVMLVGLFFLGASFVYKLIFALWLLPWLWERPAAPVELRWRRIIAWLLFAVLWLEGLMAAGLNLLARFRGGEVNLGLLKAGLVVVQLATWVLVACLTRSLLIYVWRWTRALLMPAEREPA